MLMVKPVIRRMLWCAANDFKGQGFIKTSNIMGQVIRKYNPHGDASVQMAIRNMINDFATKYPTMEGSGSWGSKQILIQQLHVIQNVKLVNLQ